MPNLNVAYLLAVLSFFGVSGINRFYLGKPVTGVIWFLTGGLFFIGTIYDLVTMERQVAEAAARRGLRAARPAPPQLALSPDPQLDVELRLLRLARHHQGRLTTTVAASELGISVTDAESRLDALAVHGHAEIEATDDGVVVYDFPSLRLAS